ncbi:TetR/AcrR family transcriptional regulator [Nonomuraea sp. MG754425]|uniref:TetR/AcrR family transcriptional regulator n=1 Tax=Nonomuraea sp. MG754425 TaxID=2570319 RepID=UPI001F1FE686|nr:TetR/AcrR family transcriptional regulator [Nonomuraea sp. MG754425]MCF6471530.1 TetR/AcrR family transcriptional regulator [Nonomuraea sp. MG754425]
MPKKVDHEERRRHLAEAVLRIAGRDGLGQAKLRDVAAEAGVSLGTVQHYFASKDEMLRYVVGYLGEAVAQRIMTGMAEPAGGRPAGSFLLSMAVAVLPLDDRRRAERRAGQAFAGLAAGVPELNEDLRRGDRWLRGRIAELIEQGTRDGELRDGLDPAHEAVVLIALIDGLASGLLTGVREPSQALDAVRYHLDRLARPV